MVIIIEDVLNISFLISHKFGHYALFMKYKPTESAVPETIVTELDDVVEESSKKGKPPPS